MDALRVEENPPHELQVLNRSSECQAVPRLSYELKESDRYLRLSLHSGRTGPAGQAFDEVWILKKEGPEERARRRIQVHDRTRTGTVWSRTKSRATRVCKDCVKAGKVLVHGLDEAINSEPVERLLDFSAFFIYWCFDACE
jgi:hypothetical protein